MNRPISSHRPARTTTFARSDTVTTHGQLFADGSVIELVAPVSGNLLRLLFWDGQKKIIGSQVEYMHRIYQAPAIQEMLLRAIRFPKGASGYGSERKLFTESINLFEKYTGLARPDAALVAAWSCSTWFPDCVSSPPTLVISSPDMGPVITLFRMLRCLGRRSLLLADINRAGFLSIMALQPTLLINQSSRSSKILDLWGTSNHRGVWVVGNRGSVCNAVGAKAVYGGMADTWTAEAIHLALPGRHDFPPLDEHDEAEIADRLQPQWLMYRLHNFRKVGESRAAVRQSGFPDSEIARNLAACIRAEPDIAQAIAPILQRQHQDAEARHGCDVSVAIVEVIWAPYHATEEIATSKIAQLVNALLRARGETLEYNPIEIGWKLKNLGLDRQRNGGGMVLQPSKANGLVIHQLAQRFGLKLRPNIGCADCCERESPAT
jgi:hypothetical protein